MLMIYDAIVLGWDPCSWPIQNFAFKKKMVQSTKRYMKKYVFGAKDHTQQNGEHGRGRQCG